MRRSDCRREYSDRSQCYGDSTKDSWRYLYYRCWSDNKEVEDNSMVHDTERVKIKKGGNITRLTGCVE